MIVAYCRCRDDSVDVTAQAFKIGAMVALCKVCGGAVPAAAYEGPLDEHEEQEDDGEYESRIAAEARREIAERFSEAGFKGLADSIQRGSLFEVAGHARMLYTAAYGENSKRDGGGYTTRFNADGTVVERKWGGGGPTDAVCTRNDGRGGAGT